MMFYRVIVLQNRLEVEDRGIFATINDAKTYIAIHRLELLDNEEMRIVEYAPKTIDNIPPQVYVTVETFAKTKDNSELYVKENRQWSIEEISIDQRPKYIPTSWNKKENYWSILSQTLPNGAAAIYQDDKNILSSFTILFPFQTSILLDEVNKVKREDLLKIAENIFNKLCEKKPKEPILILENF